ncbi:hypothetical protein K3495_g1235 [Podosphaera aphanis]|nr:hypothetical protein K3495_g1235 [Podosphaera aphanis]
MAPFFADQGYLPNFQLTDEEPGEGITCESAIAHSNKLPNILIKLKKIMTANNETMGHHYDKKHKNIIFHTGDWIMLKTDHIRTKRSCKKLSEKQIGPFKILKKITDQSYQIDLKNLVGKIHNVFHVEKLEIATSPQNGQQDYGMEWFVDDEETFITIKDIINFRYSKDGKIDYEILWSDGSKEWASEDEFNDNEVEIRSFHNRNPGKPIPSKNILARGVRDRRPPTRFC